MMKRALMTGLVGLAALGLSILAGSCGPVESTHVILKADTALHNAKTAGAASSQNPEAIYHFTAAEQYIHKAREEWGRSDFEYSVDFARRALEHANAARDKAMAEKHDED